MFQCWKCSSTLSGVLLPMSRREECKHCHSDQHVCRMCQFYDDNKGCTEERAEAPNEREKANFCDYFKPLEFNNKSNKKSQSDLAKIQLAALFGDPAPVEEEVDPALSPKQLAEKKLRDLLG